MGFNDWMKDNYDRIAGAGGNHPPASPIEGPAPSGPQMPHGGVPTLLGRPVTDYDPQLIATLIKVKAAQVQATQPPAPSAPPMGTPFFPDQTTIGGMVPPGAMRPPDANDLMNAVLKARADQAASQPPPVQPGGGGLFGAVEQPVAAAKANVDAARAAVDAAQANAPAPGSGGPPDVPSAALSAIPIAGNVVPDAGYDYANDPTYQGMVKAGYSPDMARQAADKVNKTKANAATLPAATGDVVAAVPPEGSTPATKGPVDRLGSVANWVWNDSPDAAQKVMGKAMEGGPNLPIVGPVIGAGEYALQYAYHWNTSRIGDSIYKMAEGGGPDTLNPGYYLAGAPEWYGPDGKPVPTVAFQEPEITYDAAGNRVYTIDGKPVVKQTPIEHWAKDPANATAIKSLYQDGMKDKDGKVILKGGDAVFAYYFSTQHPTDGNLFDFFKTMADAAGYDPLSLVSVAAEAGTALRGAASGARDATDAANAAREANIAREAAQTGAAAADTAAAATAAADVPTWARFAELAGKGLQGPHAINEAVMGVPGKIIDKTVESLPDAVKRIATTVGKPIAYELAPTKAASLEQQVEAIGNQVNAYANAAEGGGPTTKGVTPEGPHPELSPTEGPPAPPPTSPAFRDVGTGEGEVKYTVSNKGKVYTSTDNTIRIVESSAGDRWEVFQKGSDNRYRSVAAPFDDFDSARSAANDVFAGRPIQPRLTPPAPFDTAAPDTAAPDAGTSGGPRPEHTEAGLPVLGKSDGVVAGDIVAKTPDYQIVEDDQAHQFWVLDDTGNKVSGIGYNDLQHAQEEADRFYQTDKAAVGTPPVTTQPEQPAQQALRPDAYTPDQGLIDRRKAEAQAENDAVRTAFGDQPVPQTPEMVGQTINERGFQMDEGVDPRDPRLAGMAPSDIDRIGRENVTLRRDGWHIEYNGGGLDDTAFAQKEDAIAAAPGVLERRAAALRGMQPTPQDLPPTEPPIVGDKTSVATAPTTDATAPQGQPVPPPFAVPKHMQPDPAQGRAVDVATYQVGPNDPAAAQEFHTQWKPLLDKSTAEMDRLDAEAKVLNDQGIKSTDRKTFQATSAERVTNRVAKEIENARLQRGESDLLQQTTGATTEPYRVTRRYADAVDRTAPTFASTDPITPEAQAQARREFRSILDGHLSASDNDARNALSGIAQQGLSTNEAVATRTLDLLDGMSKKAINGREIFTEAPIAKGMADQIRAAREELRGAAPAQGDVPGGASVVPPSDVTPSAATAPSDVPAPAATPTAKPSLGERPTGQVYYSDDLSRTYGVQRLYREVGADSYENYLPGSANRIVADNIHLASTPEMALGQGASKGVLLEFDADGIKGVPNRSKPGWEFQWDQGNAEFKARDYNDRQLQDNLRSITFKPELITDRVEKARLPIITERLEGKGWTRVENADGGYTLTRPGLATDSTATPTDVASRGILDPVTRAEELASPVSAPISNLSRLDDGTLTVFDRAGDLAYVERQNGPRQIVRVGPNNDLTVVEELPKGTSRPAGQRRFDDLSSGTAEPAAPPASATEPATAAATPPVAADASVPQRPPVSLEGMDPSAMVTALRDDLLDRHNGTTPPPLPHPGPLPDYLPGNHAAGTRWTQPGATDAVQAWWRNVKAGTATGDRSIENAIRLGLGDDPVVANDIRAALHRADSPEATLLAKDLGTARETVYGPDGDRADMALNRAKAHVSSGAQVVGVSEIRGIPKIGADGNPVLGKRGNPSYGEYAFDVNYDDGSTHTIYVDSKARAKAIAETIDQHDRNVHDPAQQEFTGLGVVDNATRRIVNEGYLAKGSNLERAWNKLSTPKPGARAVDPMTTWTDAQRADYEALPEGAKFLTEIGRLDLADAKGVTDLRVVQAGKVMPASELYDNLRLAGLGKEEAIRKTVMAAHDTLAEAMTVGEKAKAQAVFDSALRKWDKATSVARQGMQYNFVTGARGALTDTISDQVKALLTGHADAFAMPKEDFALLMKAIRDTDPEMLNELKALSALRESGAELPREYTAKGRMNRWEAGGTEDEKMVLENIFTDAGMNDTLAKVVTRPLAVKFYKTLRDAIDQTKKILIFNDEYTKLLPGAQDSFVRTLQDRAIQTGEDAGDVMQRIKDTAQARAGAGWTGNFSPRDVLDATGDTGLSRSWQTANNTIRSSAMDEADRVMFTYRRTNLDAHLGHVVMFHYWGTRSLALYADVALHNPILAATFIRGFQRLKQDAAEKGHSSALMGFLDLAGSSSGMHMLWDPIQYIVPYQMFSDVSNPNDPLWKRAGLFLTPLTNGVLGAIGMSSDIPNLLGTQSVTAAVRHVADYMNANGIDLPWTNGKEVSPDYVNRVTARIIGLANDAAKVLHITSRDYAPYDQKSNEVAQIRSLIHKRAEAQYGPEYAGGSTRWTPEQVANVEDADLRAGYGGGQMEGNPLSDAAYKEWAQGQAVGQAANTVTNVSVRSGPLDQYRADSKAGYNAVVPTDAQSNAQETMKVIQSGSPGATDMAYGSAAVAHAGTPNSRAYYDSYNAIVYGSNPGAYLAPLGYTNAEVLAMPTDQRRTLADQWVASTPDAARNAALIDQQRADRTAADAPFPMDAAYGDWASKMRDGGPAYRQDLVRTNPSYAAYMAGYQSYLDTETKKGNATPMTVDEYGVTRNAYSAAMGQRGNIYDAARPTTASEYPPVALAGGAATGSAAGGNRVTTLTNDLKSYATRVSLYQDALAQLTGNPNVDIDNVEPPLRDALKAKLAAAGIQQPYLSAEGTRYLGWAKAQTAMGGPTDMASYFAFKDRLRVQYGSDIAADQALDAALNGQPALAPAGVLGPDLGSGGTGAASGVYGSWSPVDPYNGYSNATGATDPYASHYPSSGGAVDPYNGYSNATGAVDPYYGRYPSGGGSADPYAGR